MTEAYVYILQNEQGKYYIGSTVDLDSRIRHHREGHTPSTKRMGKMKLVFYQRFPSLKVARTIEARLKKFKRRDFIEKIIKDGKIKLQW